MRALLDELGVTSHDVKAWAVEQGLVPAVVRGRIGMALVEAYAEHHTPLTPHHGADPLT